MRIYDYSDGGRVLTPSYHACKTSISPWAGHIQDIRVRLLVIREKFWFFLEVFTSCGNWPIYTWAILKRKLHSYTHTHVIFLQTEHHFTNTCIEVWIKASFTLCPQLTVTAEHKVIKENWGLAYTARFVICPTDSPPLYVSLVEKLTDPRPVRVRDRGATRAQPG